MKIRKTAGCHSATRKTNRFPTLISSSQLSLKDTSTDSLRYAPSLDEKLSALGLNKMIQQSNASGHLHSLALKHTPHCSYGWNTIERSFLKKHISSTKQFEQQKLYASHLQIPSLTVERSKLQMESRSVVLRDQSLSHTTSRVDTK